MKIFQSIGIAGIGLLGGSVALAAKKKKLAEKIYGYTRSMATIKRALDLGVIDESFENFSLMIEQCEFVILCAPISINIELAVTIGRKRPKLLFTDVGSTKKTIVDVVEKNFPPGHGFCGSHPMAGSEKRGVEFSDPALFSGKTVILTPVQNADASASETIKKFWQRLDAKVISMDAALHDEICAYTSHFPHLVAFLLIELLEDKMGQQNVLDCIGTGFRDTTRIAASDEEIWSEIFINNRENMLRTIEKFKKNLGKIEKWIKESDVENLKIWIEKVKEARMRI